jgi:hypothetical protein
MFFSIRRFVAISAFHTQSKSKKNVAGLWFFLCFLLVVWGEICTKHTAYDLDIAQFLIYFSEFAGKGTTNIRNSVKRVDISVNRVVIIWRKRRTFAKSKIDERWKRNYSLCCSPLYYPLRLWHKK